MSVDLFLQHHRLPPVPEGALPSITAMAAGMGLRTRWDEVHRALFVDSPLHNRVVACAAAAVDPPDPLADRIIADLSRRIQAAGGLTAIPGSHRAVVSIHFRVHTGAANSGSEMGLALWHGWLPQSRRLGERVAASLGPATGLPVRVASRWGLWGRQLHIHLSVPTPGACDHLTQRIADGIWSGVMAFLSRRRGLPAVPPAAEALAGAAVPLLSEPVPLAPAAVSVIAHSHNYQIRSAPLSPGGASHRPIRPGITHPSPVYVWNWSISPYEWEVVRPKPAPAADAPEPTETPFPDHPDRPVGVTESNVVGIEEAGPEPLVDIDGTVCNALVPLR